MVVHDREVRYARQISLPQIGPDGQKKLNQSSVLIVGAGGLGAPLALYLASAGIGRLGLVDADRVALSNLPRQILYEAGDIGRLKTEAAVDALYDRNPEVKLDIHSLRLNAENAATLIKEYDIIADGSDNFETRLTINAASQRAQKTLVSASVQGFEGQISTFKSYVTGPCYQCFLGEVVPDNANCSAAGVLGPVAGIMACWQGVEIIKELLNIGESLSGRLIGYSALSGKVRESYLPKDKSCSVCSA